jgi:hypothetical protein
MANPQTPHFDFLFGTPEPRAPVPVGSTRSSFDPFGPGAPAARAPQEEAYYRSITSSLLSDRPPAGKRKRIEIDPIHVESRGAENVFTVRPPLTPTSPMVPPPNFTMIPSTPGNRLLTPFGLSEFSDDLDSIMNFDPSGASGGTMTEAEVQSFVEFMSYVPLPLSTAHLTLS